MIGAGDNQALPFALRLHAPAWLAVVSRSLAEALSALLPDLPDNAHDCAATPLARVIRSRSPVEARHLDRLPPSGQHVTTPAPHAKPFVRLWHRW